MTGEDIYVMQGEEDDLPAALEMIRQLAVYEKAPAEVQVNLREFRRYFDNELFEFYIAKQGDEPLGIALYYIAYSTWKGPILYLDDLIVREKHRRKGVGKALFDTLIEKCKDLSLRQLRWHVLDWNDPAINFYKKYEAELDPEWLSGRLTFTF